MNRTIDVRTKIMLIINSTLIFTLGFSFLLCFMNEKIEIALNTADSMKNKDAVMNATIKFKGSITRGTKNKTMPAMFSFQQ